MNWRFWERKEGGLSINTVIERLEAAYMTGAMVPVTPESCMQSPTVHAIVTAVCRRFQSMPVHVFQTSASRGRETKEHLPSHPVTRLLAKPNDFQSRVDYWGDSISRYLRYGNVYSLKGRGVTGPIRKLYPLDPSCMTVEQDKQWNVTYRYGDDGRQAIYDLSEIHHVRTSSRNAYKGDSPVMDVRESIALDIAAEKFGAAFFGNGAMPFLVFTHMQGSQGFKTTEQEKQFREDFQTAFGAKNRFRSLVLPKGFDKPTPVPIENDKAQFIETRKYQRTVIAGAFGVPPHLVGDLERGTFNNVEQQSLDFTTNVILPIARTFEAAMERDLLTDADRAGGVVIRFNIEGTLRGDMKSRYESYQLALDRGVFSPNEVRELEGFNPIPAEKGGDDYVKPINMGTKEQIEEAASKEPNGTPSNEAGN